MVSGRYVAYLRRLDATTGFRTSPFVEVVKIRRGRRSPVHRFKTYDAGVGDSSNVGELTDLVLAPGGGVGWITRRPQGQPDLEVHYVDWGTVGEENNGLIDAAPDIVPGSLALSSSDVYWRRADGPRTVSRG